MQVKDYNNIIKIEFQYPAKLNKNAQSTISKLFSKCRLSDSVLVVEPLIKELTPVRIGAIFNSICCQRVCVIFQSDADCSKYSSNTKNSVELIVPSTEHFFRFYEMLYEDVITCNCLKNKVETSRVVEAIKNSEEEVSNRQGLRRRGSGRRRGARGGDARRSGES